jgi:hypothetical protein
MTPCAATYKVPSLEDMTNIKATYMFLYSIKRLTKDVTTKNPNNFSPQRLGFNVLVVCVKSVIGQSGDREAFCQHFSFPLPVTIPPVLHTHLSAGAGIVDPF